MNVELSVTFLRWSFTWTLNVEPDDPQPERTPAVGFAITAPLDDDG